MRWSLTPLRSRHPRRSAPAGGAVRPGTRAERPSRPDGTSDEDVRRQLARELHDQVVQELTATLVDLENFRRRPFDEHLVSAQVDQVQDSLRRTLRELRQMLFDLRDEAAWQPTFTSSLVEFARRFAERTGVQVRVAVSRDWPQSIRSAAAQHMSRIIQEAVTNARLHGGAHLIDVSLRLAGPDVARVTIQDDGRGLDHEVPDGLGVIGMRERAALLGGRLMVEDDPRGGARVRLDVPWAALV